MIPIFNDSGQRMPIVYDTDLRLNEAIGGNPLHIYEVNAVMVRDVFSGTIEPRPVGDGSEAYGMRKSGKIVRIDGIMRAPTFAALSDMQSDLRGYLDPALLSQQDTLGHGFSPLAFTALSAAGDEESYYLARPAATPDFMWDQYLGKNAPFRLEFFCADPRRYWLTANIYTFVGSQTKSVTQEGNYPSVPSIEITMTGAGALGYRLINYSNDPDGFLYMDLRGTIAGDVIEVFPDAKIVTKNGNRADEVVMDTTDWNLLVQPGTANLQVVNGTNSTTEIIVYHTFSM